MPLVISSKIAELKQSLIVNLSDLESLPHDVQTRVLIDNAPNLAVAYSQVDSFPN